jgi:hypothetical protein
LLPSFVIRLTIPCYFPVIQNNVFFILKMAYANIRPRANTTRGLDFENIIKSRAHKGGVRIGHLKN